MTRARTFLLSALLTAVVLAGCLADDPGEGSDGDDAETTHGLPAPILWCADAAAGGGCNQEMTPDEGRQGNEVTIAVDPTDPANIVGGAKDYYPADAGECVWDGVYVSHDGGATYADRSFDGSPWRALSDPGSFEPNYASQFWCTTDPVVYFDVNGNFYYLLMAYQADRVTGSKTCKDVCPSGALNDWAFNRAVQIVAVSGDGGDSFHTFTPVFEGSYPVDFHDKGWVAASTSGTIHVMWLAGLLPGNLYFRSTDGGKTYSDPEVLASTIEESGQGSMLDVGPGKEVYATWRAAGGIVIRRSFDEGLTWDPLRVAVEYEGAAMPGLSTRDRRGGMPAMATDRFSESPFAGAVYLAWQGKGVTGASDVFFSASYDRGETFSEPVVVNDDVLPNGTMNAANWQIFPAVSVSPGGVIDVSWMDSRLDATGYRLDQYHTYSLDGGKTWAANFRVRDANDSGWDPALSHHQNGMIFIGDYNDIDSSWGAAHPVWPDTRSGSVVDVYTAVVQRPLFAKGWSAEDVARLRAELVEKGLVAADHPFLGYDPPADESVPAP